jgi:hypothetical protein
MFLFVPMGNFFDVGISNSKYWSYSRWDAIRKVRRESNRRVPVPFCSYEYLTESP